MNRIIKITSQIIFFSAISFCSLSQILPTFGDSRTGTTGLQFLKIYPDARSAALSGSTAASANDVSALYWNPASLTKMDTYRFSFQFGYTGWYAGIKMNYGGFVFSKDKLNFWGLSIIHLNSGEMPVTTEFSPNGNGQTFSSGDLLAGISYGKILSDNFSFGLTGKYVSEYIGNIKVRNGLFDLGLLYSVGVRQTTRFSVGISNFGFNVSPDGKVRISTLKGEKTVSDFERMVVPSIFRLSIITPLYRKGFHQLFISGQLNHPTDNNESVCMGLEYLFRKVLILRTGYEFSGGQNGWPSFGLGLQLRRNFGNVRLDYSFNNKEYLGNVNRLTLGFSLK